jgi:N-formylglutamate amidohydrolase
MIGQAQNWSDSLRQDGGSIPDGDGASAFSLILPEPSPIPVMIAVPHAGRIYPGPLLSRMRNPGFAALRLEDRYVDRLATAVAKASGATLLVAHAPRAMIDLNRADDDVDWEMIADSAGSNTAQQLPGHHLGHRSRSGLGLIPRRLSGLGELWKTRHVRQDLIDRIEAVHRPYHSCLSSTLESLRARWGAVLLIDLHSMPPLNAASHRDAPEFVIGDRFGASCDGSLIGAGFAWLGAARRIAAHNRPYAGGYVLERHGDPKRGIHALQLEIDRSKYLDARLAEPGPGFAAMAQLLAGLVHHLAQSVADLGRSDAGPNGASNWPIAAE